MPFSYMEGKNLINCSRCIAEYFEVLLRKKENNHSGGDKIIRPPAWKASTFATGLQKHLFLRNKKGKYISADNPLDRNLSSYIMECGSSEKFELLLEKCQLIERRTFFRNIC
jgi:hypothetical protein